MNKDSGFIPYGRQTIEADDIAAVVEALKSPYLTQGKRIPEFEEKLANYVGAKYAVVLSSATAALHVACLALKMGKEDELITTAVTFVASSNCALYCGSSVQFTDIDSKTFNMSPADLEKKISAKTKLVIPVHMAGQSADMHAIHEIVSNASKKSGKKNYIIEDGSHALGATYQGRRVGDCHYSDMTVFSFHPVKCMTTGEGGAITTNDKELYDKLCMFRSHGITRNLEQLTMNPGPWYYEQQLLGYNYRITDFQCALGMSQLAKLDRFNERRKEIVKLYNKAFAGIDGLTTPYEDKDASSSWHLYILNIDFKKYKITRGDFMKKLLTENIGTQVHYIPIYKQPYYQRLGFNEVGFSNCEKYYETCISIPIFPNMTDQDVTTVVATIKKVLGIK